MSEKKEETRLRAIRIELKPTRQLEDWCVRAKNLYNVATYIVRQEFFNKKRWMQYTELYHTLKDHECYLALKEVTDSYIPQQLLRQVEQVWRGFFRSVKAWKKEPQKFKSKPHLPKYKTKDGQHLLIFTRGRIRIRQQKILFPNNMMKRGMPTFDLKCFPFSSEAILRGRLVPYYDRYVLELICEVKEEPYPYPIQGSTAIGVDLGVNNLVTTSDGIIVKGGVVKSISQYFNKQLARYSSMSTKYNQKTSTKRIIRLQRRRADKIHDFFHKTSRFIIDYCLENNISTIIVGYNEQWKQKSSLGRRNNQNFVQIPFLKLVQMLEHKGSLAGITVVRVPEAYTSIRCSHCGHTSRSNRRSRGLYVCRSCGSRFNADHNAARNILLSSSQVVLPTGVSPRLTDSRCVTHHI
ncbi:MAG: RNA-guided endonuclease InsQ/TnpB family protein [Candidatus Hodarchaeales archaeon]